MSEGSSLFAALLASDFERESDLIDAIFANWDAFRGMVNIDGNYKNDFVVFEFPEPVLVQGRSQFGVMIDKSNVDPSYWSKLVKFVRFGQ